MSIQSEIDRNLSEQGRRRYSFVIKGQSGSATVPKDVHVRFYACSISSLTLEGNNGIFIEGGTCGAVDAQNSYLAARGTQFTGEAQLRGCRSDLYDVTATSPWRLQERTHLRVDNSQFLGGDVALDLSGGSQARATRCSLQGLSTAAVRAVGGSNAALSTCDLVQGVETALWAVNSVIEAVECQQVLGTGTTAVRVQDSGRAELRACQLVQGAIQAVEGSNYGLAVLSGCKDVLGQGGPAVKLTSGAGVEIRNFTNLRGQGASALKLSDGAAAAVSDGDLLQSDAQDALELSSNSQATVHGVTRVIGLGRCAATLTSGSSLVMRGVETATGQGSHGISSDASSAVLSDVQTLLGVGGHGYSGSGGSRFEAQRVATLSGQGGDGVSAQGGSSVALQDGQTVTGQAGHGVHLQSSRGSLTGIATVAGQAGDGLRAEAGSRAQVASVQSMTGAAGHGAFVEGGRLDVVLVPDLTGASGDGVHAEGAEVRVRKSTLTGSTTGLYLEQSRAKTQEVTANAPEALHLDLSRHESVDDTFNGDAEITTSVLDATRSAVSGDVTSSDSVFLGRGGSLGSGISSDSDALALLRTTLPDGSATDSGILGVKAAIGSVALSDVGAAVLAGSQGFSGEGGVLSAQAGNPEDGVDYVRAGGGTVRAQDRAVDFVDLTDGDVHAEDVAGDNLDMTGGDVKLTDVAGDNLELNSGSATLTDVAGDQLSLSNTTATISSSLGSSVTCTALVAVTATTATTITAPVATTITSATITLVGYVNI